MRLRAMAATLLIAAAAGAQEQRPPETSGVSGQNQPNASAGNGQAFADPSLLFGGKDGAFVGLALDVNTDWFGVETLTDWVGNPTLMAGRAYVRPFGDTPILRGWAIGFSGATDRSAPIDVSGPLQSDAQGNPVIVNQRAIYAVG